MTIQRDPRRDLVSDVDQALPVEPVDPDEHLRHWLPTYAPHRSLDENAFSLARALWGKTRAEWTWCLANEVAARFPEATECDEDPGWVAGVLWAAAVDAGMQERNELWEHILDDITQMTGASRQTAERRWELIKGVGLNVPAHPPARWI